MNTSLWGSSGWYFLHTLTYIYPTSPSYSDKLKMKNFMNSLSYILPCTYCRDSFLKYTISLPINEFLVNREKLIEWLYKIHNKVNKKLRSQGLCNHKNPTFENIQLKYKPIINKINQLCNINNDTNNDTNNYTNNDTNNDTNDNTIDLIINYICNLGQDFLGSIVFNYQGYFSNCHTKYEKINIIKIYHSFFNSIIPLICSCLNKFSIKCSKSISGYINKLKLNDKLYNRFKIKNILTENEAYTKLIEWFYNCNKLCDFNNKFKSFEEYINYYKKHIVLSCNNPLTMDGHKIKSCRKSITKLTKKKL